MHGNPGGGTKWNWVCDPHRLSCACPSVCPTRVRVYVLPSRLLPPRAGTQVHRPTALRKKTIDFHLPPRSRAPRSTKAARIEATPLGRLARPARPAFRSGKTMALRSVSLRCHPDTETEIERPRPGGWAEDEMKWLPDRAFPLMNFDTCPVCRFESNVYLTCGRILRCVN